MRNLFVWRPISCPGRRQQLSFSHTFVALEDDFTPDNSNIWNGSMDDRVLLSLLCYSAKEKASVRHMTMNNGANNERWRDLICFAILTRLVSGANW